LTRYVIGVAVGRHSEHFSLFKKLSHEDCAVLISWDSFCYQLNICR